MAVLNLLTKIIAFLITIYGGIMFYKAKDKLDRNYGTILILLGNAIAMSTRL